MFSFQKRAVTIAVAMTVLTACGGDNSTVSAPAPILPPSPPAPSNSLEQSFPVSADVFGIKVRATSSTDSEKVLHAANVMAEYLDNNEDGVADNALVVERMISEGATLIMAPTEASLERAAQGIEQSDSFQALFGSETFPNNQGEQFDATIEEVLHLITHVGYAKVYPEIFGEQVDSVIADAMDVARGGRFETIPTNYPEGAWYTYDDSTCDYSCMVTEYTYWALTSILGAQENRLEDIQNEWTLNTREKVRTQDPAVYAILTDPQYGLATSLPIGEYDGFEISLEGETTVPTPGAPTTNEILQSAMAANPGHMIAFTDLGNVYMMSPDGSGKTLLADASPIAGYVSWGPEAQYVYFASAKGEAESAWEAFRVNVQDKKLTKLTDFGRDVRSLGVSPDGNYLAISIMSGNSNIGNNNDNLTQFHTDLYIINMDVAEAKWESGETLSMADMQVLVSSPASEQFWYEELNWSNALPNDGGLPILAYTKTWRYDEDDVSYTHAYTIRADGSENMLLLENKDMPIWDFQGDRITFLDNTYYELVSQSVRQLTITGIDNEVSAPAISPDGGFIIFEVGDENRRAGMARVSDDSENPGIIIGDSNAYEPRWSPKPLKSMASAEATVIGATSSIRCRSVEAACFIVDQDRAEMYGVIGEQITKKVSTLLTDFPSVRTIVMMDVPGSEDDESNLRAAKMIYDNGLNTHVLSNSVIASGGVDFFLAGNRRTIEAGAQLGVHSWGTDDGVIATELPRDHPEHQMYIEFYQHIMLQEPEEFYFFTLQAASAESMHFMTGEELVRWMIARQ